MGTNAMHVLKTLTWQNINMPKVISNWNWINWLIPKQSCRRKHTSRRLVEGMFPGKCTNLFTRNLKMLCEPAAVHCGSRLKSKLHYITTDYETDTLTVITNIPALACCQGFFWEALVITTIWRVSLKIGQLCRIIALCLVWSSFVSVLQRKIRKLISWINLGSNFLHVLYLPFNSSMLERYLWAFAGTSICAYANHSHCEDMHFRNQSNSYKLNSVIR